MPLARAERIAAEVRETVVSPQTAERLIGMGYVPHGDAPAEFTPMLEALRKRFAEVARAYGANPPG
jgi:tripartite-type tricarboxylate transporter receptor subunit TctC